MNRRRFFANKASGGGGNVPIPDFQFCQELTTPMSTAISTGYKLSNPECLKWVMFFYVEDLPLDKQNGDYYVAIRSASFGSKTIYGNKKGYNLYINCVTESGTRYSLNLNKVTQTWSTSTANSGEEGYAKPIALARDENSIYYSTDGANWLIATNEFEESTSAYYPDLNVGGYNGFGNYKKAITPMLECDLWLGVNRDDINLTSYFAKYQ